MDRLVTVGKVFATLGGGAWTVKSGLIIILNDNFQPAEGVLYFLGVGGILLGAVGFGAYIGRRWAGIPRWLGFVGSVVAAIAITAMASSFVQEAVADAYAGGNVGLEEEMGILTPGLIWLAIGLYLTAATYRARANKGPRPA